MDFFNNPITAEQFHNAVDLLQKTSNLVATHNATNPENIVFERSLRNYFSHDVHTVSEERKANVRMCLTEDEVKSFIEAQKIVVAVKNHVRSIHEMGKGLMASVQGNSQARRDRLWLSNLTKHLEVAETFKRELDRLSWSFGEEGLACTLPTSQSIKELRASCKHNGDGLKYETDQLLRQVAGAGEWVIKAIRALPFPEHGQQELLDAANEHAGHGWPHVYGDALVEAMVKTMKGLTPKTCVEADLGADWDRPMNELVAFDALRSCVDLDPNDEEKVAEWHTNLLEWIEKRALVAQG